MVRKMTKVVIDLTQILDVCESYAHYKQNSEDEVTDSKALKWDPIKLNFLLRLKSQEQVIFTFS